MAGRPLVRVEWAVACRYAEVGPDGLATIVGAGIDCFWPAELPAVVPVLVAIKVVGAHGELVAARQHELISSVLDPQMAEVAKLSFTFAVERGDLHPEGWEGGTVIPTLHRFPVEAEGAYTLDIAVDGNHHTVPIMVRLGPAPSG